MATFTARVTVERPDVELLVAAIPTVLRRFRDLTFGDDGSLIHAGRRIEGLHLDHGTHPRVGARYTAVLTPPPDQSVPAKWTPDAVAPDAVAPDVLTPDQLAAEPPAPEVVSYEIVADDARQSVLRTESGKPATTIVVAVQNPMNPTGLRCDFGSELAGASRWLDGPVTGTGTVALDRFPPAPAGEPQMTASAEHHRGRGAVSARVEEQPDQRWLVTVRLEVHGRGLLRPVVGVAARVLLRSRWQQWVDGLPAELVKLQQELPPGGPDELADKAVDDFIESLVTELPSGARA